MVDETKKISSNPDDWDALDWNAVINDYLAEVILGISLEELLDRAKQSLLDRWAVEDAAA